MGKNLVQQRRGRGTPRYRVPSHRWLGKASYAAAPLEGANGKIVKVVHSPGKLSPFAGVELKKSFFYIPATEGMYVGQEIPIKRISEIPEGSKICNIELRPGDGGLMCKSSGAFATLISKEGSKAVLLMPSKQKKIISTNCKAIQGTIASAGRMEKPFIKAGTRHFKMQVRGKLYPITSGVAKNAVNHPFGGQTRPGKPKSVSRHMPPGKKVGSISPRRMGRKNK
ncbi:MAG: 50S ribosomal protein L2 [Candidatus Aenigmarchaeota archaeon]|nr:50S ribosomal protein L2 [Candidatus Aenigmarchaeota archaeon]